MKLLYFLADMFINTFGITRPTQQTRRQTAFFILGLILFALAAMIAAGTVVHFGHALKCNGFASVGNLFSLVA